MKKWIVVQTKSHRCGLNDKSGKKTKHSKAKMILSEEQTSEDNRAGHRTVDVAKSLGFVGPANEQISRGHEYERKLGPAQRL